MRCYIIWIFMTIIEIHISLYFMKTRGHGRHLSHNGAGGHRIYILLWAEGRDVIASKLYHGASATSLSSIFQWQKRATASAESITLRIRVWQRA